MGAGLSTHPETVEELCDIYHSPKHVRQRLLETLYSGCVPSSLVNRFYAQNIRDSGSPRVWTETTFADFLIRAYPGLETVVKPAIPALFRVFLHHGCYPFKPGDDHIGITLEGLATAVALLTSADRTSITIREEIEGHIFERPRNWTERCRLLFQSVCDTDWGRLSSDDRQISDDEDLLDALYAGIPERARDNVPREILQEVGSTLPSSHSCKMDGRVTLQDMRALLRFLLVVTSGSPQSSSPVVPSGLDGVMSALLSAFGPREGSVDWALFKAVLHQDMPYFLTYLATVFLHDFPVEGFPFANWRSELDLSLWSLPPSIRVGEQNGARSFLSEAQFFQLGLFLPRSHHLTTFTILHQGKPRDVQPSTIQILLSGLSSPRILLVHGTTDRNSSPVVLGAFVPSLSTWNQGETNHCSPQDPFSVPETDDDCFFQLSPKHAVYRGSYEKTRVDVGARGTLSLHIGGASIWLEKGLSQGSLSGGGETLRFVPESVEIWGRS